MASFWARLMPNVSAIFSHPCHDRFLIFKRSMIFLLFDFFLLERFSGVALGARDFSRVFSRWTTPQPKIVLFVEGQTNEPRTVRKSQDACTGGRRENRLCRGAHARFWKNAVKYRTGESTII